MPPPPPPSKSYLLQLDTDSEDEEEVIIRRPDPPQIAPELPELMQDSTLSMCSIAASNGNSASSIPVDEDTDHDASENTLDAALSPKSKKKRRRKKKNRSKKSKKKHVSFGDVSIRLIERTLGGDGVPADGGWSLGLSESVLEDLSDVSLDTFEQERRLLLENRFERKTGAPATADQTLETRQFDYRKQKDEAGNSLRNPLFQPLIEEERHELLTGIHHHAKKGSPKSSNKPKHNTRSRSRSFAADDETGPYDPVEVRHVRNELEDIRNTRNKDGAMGCTCRKLSVYLPPKTGGGKKSQHKRLAIPKLHAELKKRHILPQDKKTREELEQLLHDAVEQEPCCPPGGDCECSRNALGCQADACTCWYESHQTKDVQKEHANISIEGIGERCGNKYGMYVVDFDAIKTFRTNMICQVIEPPTTTAS